MYSDQFNRFMEADHFDWIMRSHFEVTKEGGKQLFSASANEIARMLLCSGAFRSALLSNDLIFYQGCLYSPKAFLLNGDRIVLSEEAKTNPEKFCLLHQNVKYDGTVITRVGSEMHLDPESYFDLLNGYRWDFVIYRPEDERIFNFNHRYDYFYCEPAYEPPKSISWESSIFSVASEKAKENQFDRAAFARYMDEIRDLPDDFGGLLQTFVSASKKSQEEAAFEADMSARNLSRLMKNKQQPKLKTVVALCISLHLFPLFSEYLISSAGYSLRNTAEGIAYKLLINQFYMEDLHFCNDFLCRIGLDPLTENPFSDLGGERCQKN